MARTIWKFELEVTEYQVIEMPTGAEILSLQVQNNKPCIWVALNTKKIIEKRQFKTYGTGYVLSSAKRKFIGTYQLNNGLVFHVFEEIDL